MAKSDDQNKEFVLDAGLQQRPVEKWEEWGHVIRTVKGVNALSSGILYRNWGVQV